ncbi:MAG: hypothetical protein GF332_03280 [Candidatus Moranbacteria bacterium]|nr:hypothetical protein [Candidatus Moranbacteria bacterium]
MTGCGKQQENKNGETKNSSTDVAQKRDDKAQPDFNDNEMQTSEDNTVDQSEKKTLNELGTLTKSMKCTYEDSTQDQEISATIYIDTQGERMRMEQIIDKNDKNYIIFKQGFMYVWTTLKSIDVGGFDVSKMGVKISNVDFKEAAEKMSQQEIGNIQQMESLGETGYECTNWQVDESMFDLPKDINFINANESPGGLPL